MPTFGRYTHALISRVPSSFQTIKTLDGTSIDLDRARQQQETLVSTLRGLDIDVLELPPDEDSPNSVFINDCAVVLQGLALICNPGGGARDKDVITARAVLKKELGLAILELDSPSALLNGSDVLFTGREFFVGIGKETNTEGALLLANTWPEYPCTPVKLDGSKRLRDRVTMAGLEVLSVSSGSNSQNVIKRIEREATHRYSTLTVPEEDAANCLYVNGTLIHIDNAEAAESVKLLGERVDYPRLTVPVSEFQKSGRGLTSLCLLVRKSKTIRTI